MSGNWKLEDFDFELNEELIARYPAKNREDSRLLVVDRRDGTISARDKFSQILQYVQKGDLLVFNNTKVSKRRVFLLTSKGRIHECIFLEEDNGQWHVLLKNSAKLKQDEVLQDASGHFRFQFIRGREKTFLHPFVVLTEEIFDRIGTIPIPPYLQRSAEPQDEIRYQTIFASVPGSVAAPTAGLHFSEDLKNKLLEREIGLLEITLQVGYGTFAPLQPDQIENKKLHEETYYISPNSAELLNRTKGKNRIISIGSTTLRALESSYDIKNGKFKSGNYSTQIFLNPDDKVYSVDGLITNFHLPKSSLILLVAAFAGKELTISAYKYAIQNKFRFYSYGDAMLIL